MPWRSATAPYARTVPYATRPCVAVGRLPRNVKGDDGSRKLRRLRGGQRGRPKRRKRQQQSTAAIALTTLTNWSYRRCNHFSTAEQEGWRGRKD